jgi:hypothetical protein
MNSDKVFRKNLFQICEKVLSNRFHSKHKNMPKNILRKTGRKKREGGPSLEISP